MSSSVDSGRDTRSSWSKFSWLAPCGHAERFSAWSPGGLPGGWPAKLLDPAWSGRKRPYQFDQCPGRMFPVLSEKNAHKCHAMNASVLRKCRRAQGSKGPTACVICPLAALHLQSKALQTNVMDARYCSRCGCTEPLIVLDRVKMCVASMYACTPVVCARSPTCCLPTRQINLVAVV